MPPRDYVVLIAPAPSSAEMLQWENPRSHGSIVLVHDPDKPAASGRRIFSNGDCTCTKGAARLIAALAGDDDLKSYAEREGVTIYTARFHLRTAMTRTGARTQAELVRIAVRLLRDFALGVR